MTNPEKAARSIEQAIALLRQKDTRSTLVERYFLLYEAWDRVADLPQPLAMGEGLYEVLSRCSLPTQEHDLLLGRFDDHVPTPEEQARLDELWKRDPNQNPIVLYNGGHRVIDSENLVQKGLFGLREETERRLQRALAEKEGEKAETYLRGRLRTYEAMLLYIERYGKAARAAGLPDCAAVCESLTRGAPQTFREALQLLLFVYTIYLVYGGCEVACLNLGRLDDYLLPLYRRDLETGIMTEADAGAFWDDFSAKMNLHLGRGEHQMAYLDENYQQTGWLRNPVYESPGYVTLGGYSEKTAGPNPLSLLMARHIHPLLKNPIYVCRYTKETDEALWSVLCEKIAQNASLLLYNDDVVIPAYRHVGIEPSDALEYSVHPCNWASLAGNMTMLGFAFEKNLPQILQTVLDRRQDYASMDDLYAAVREEYACLLQESFARYRRGDFRADPGLGLSDCFQKETLERASRISKYPVLYTFLRNIGTAADMLAAIDELVFRKKAVSLEELCRAAEENFEGHEDLLALCRCAPKYGTDDDRADSHAVRLANEVLDVVDREAVGPDGKRDVLTLQVTINDSNHLADGKEMGATVDGRLAGQPLSENLSGTVGTHKSVTSLLNSVSKLPFNRIHSGTLNIRLRRADVSGEKGAERIRALIDSYFRRGGMQLQFSIADTAELRAAQKDPDSYRDLLVRITGYSAVFVDMSRGAQEEFIRREEMQ